MIFLFNIFFTIFFAPLFAEQSEPYLNLDDFDKDIVISEKIIKIPKMKYSYNPTMIEYGDKILMAFRYQPDFHNNPWNSYVALVLLDQDFSLSGEVQILNLRKDNPKIDSYAEDPRIISCNDKIYILYNDTLDESQIYRREMYIVEVVLDDKGKFDCNIPILLKHPANFPERYMEKNWSPFVYKGQLLLEYTIKPHEILLPNLETGECQLFGRTDFKFDKGSEFTWDELRGGTPAILDGDQYFAFFHSYKVVYSNTSTNKRIHHYFMGAYTFNAKPPFRITAVSETPINGTGLYTYSKYEKRVVYPGGFIQRDDKIFVIYGKDDLFIYVAELDKQKLLESLKPVI